MVRRANGGGNWGNRRAVETCPAAAAEAAEESDGVAEEPAVAWR